MTDTVLFQRSVTVTVDTIEFTSLDCSFNITKTLKPEPNTCELTVYNMTREHQAQIEALSSSKKGIPCRIEAGYESETSLVWLGDLRQAQTTRDGSDWVTTFTSGDGEKAWANARQHVSFGPGISVETAMRSLVRALGIAEGNLSQVVAKLKLAGSATFPSGANFTGSVSRNIVDIARSAGLEVSTQDGALQFLERGKALSGLALKIPPSMIDSPSVDNKGLLSVRVLMIPGVQVGGIVVLDAERIKGNYRIEKATWTGDTHESDWYIDIEAKRY